MARASIYMVLAMVGVPLSDSAAKALSVHFDASSGFLVWTRLALGALLCLPWLGRRVFDRELYLNARLLLRAALLAGAIFPILKALETEPLANVFGAFFVAPLVSFAISAVVLRERATLPQLGLVVLGFLAVLMVVEPQGGLSAGLAWALVGGVSYGAFLTASRWLAGTRPPEELLYSQLALGTIMLAPLGLAEWPVPSAGVLSLTVASAGISMLANLFVLMAYARAPASRLAPLVYIQLVAATAFGWLFFGDIPSSLAFAGLALLIVTGVLSVKLRSQ